MLCHIIRFDLLTDIIHINIIAFMIAVAAEFAVFFLMFFHFEQQVPILWNER